jgi:D-aspartate ligase
MANPCAIVIGLDSITGLQTARILARHKVPVIGIAKDPNDFCCRTNVCQQILFADTKDDDLINALAKLGPTLNQKAILFPCTDLSVLSISLHRGEIDRWYHVVLPEHDVVELLMDKVRFHFHAEQCGLPVPGAAILRNREDVKDAVEKLTFPCILKPPVKTPAWEQHARAKVFKVVNATELFSLYDQYSQWASELMVQEWVEGSESELYSCNCYFDSESRPIVTFISRKLRQWPPQVGVSCLGEECRNDTVLFESIRLFESVHYRGLGYVEMKRDSRTGRYLIIEPNIGRPTGRSAIAEAGGVELLYSMYCDNAQLPLPANLEQRYEGAKWVYLRRDLQSAFHYWRAGELTTRDWWWSLRGLKHDAVFSWSDPAPFFQDMKRSIARLLRTRPSNGSTKLALQREVGINVNTNR